MKIRSSNFCMVWDFWSFSHRQELSAGRVDYACDDSKSVSSISLLLSVKSSRVHPPFQDLLQHVIAADVHSHSEPLHTGKNSWNQIRKENLDNFKYVGASQQPRSSSSLQDAQPRDSLFILQNTNLKYLANPSLCNSGHCRSAAQPGRTVQDSSNVKT